MKTRAELEADPCRCVRCKVCAGKGEYAVDLGGRYVGPSKCDDLDDYETCDQCERGITEVCDRCRELEECDDE